MDYKKMNENSAVEDATAEKELLAVVVRELSPVQKKRIIAALEKDRKAFSHSGKPGHAVWYEHKLALCAAAERIIT